MDDDDDDKDEEEEDDGLAPSGKLSSKVAQISSRMLISPKEAITLLASIFVSVKPLRATIVDDIELMANERRLVLSDFKSERSKKTSPLSSNFFNKGPEPGRRIAKTTMRNKSV